MNYSAILVIALPGRLQDVITAINRIEGVEAHISDPDSDRLICTIEAPTTDDEVRLFPVSYTHLTLPTNSLV